MFGAPTSALESTALIAVLIVLCNKTRFAHVSDQFVE